MYLDYYWKDQTSPGQQMAEDFRLVDPNPFLGNTGKSASACFMFESEGTNYMWNSVTDLVFKITNPTSKRVIVSEVLLKGTKSLQLQQLPPLE